MFSRVFSALCLAGCLISCSDPVGPPLPSGLFVLERVSGVALPLVIREDSVFRYVRVADTLMIGSDGDGEQVSVQRVERRDGNSAPYTVSQRVPIRMRSTASGLRFLRGCPINAGCVPTTPESVSVTADRLAVSYGAEQWQYRAAVPE